MARIITMAMGDSNTMGSDLRGGYRRPLNNLAPNLAMVGSICVFSSDYTVGQHEGTPGAVISGVGEVSLDQVDVYNPAVVLLMAGTNNVSVGGQTIDEMVIDYVHLAMQLIAKASVSLVIVSSIPPRNTLDGKDEETNLFNARLPAAFANAPAGIVFVDVCNVLSVADLEVDGVHVTTAGHVKLAASWYDALVANDVQVGETRRPLGSGFVGYGQTFS